MRCGWREGVRGRVVAAGDVRCWRSSCRAGSLWARQFMTHLGTRAAKFAVAHNRIFNGTLCYGTVVWVAQL